VANSGDQPVTGTIKFDLKGLDVNVRKVWAEYTAAVPLDGQAGVNALENAQQGGRQQISFNAYAGELYYTLKKGESRVFSLDRY
jgi:hypothetical protein